MKGANNKHYTSMLLPLDQKSELRDYANAFGIKRSIFTRMILSYGLYHFKQTPGDCFKVYVNQVKPATGQPADQEKMLQEPEPVKAGSSQAAKDAGSKFIKAIATKSADPGDVAGTIYDIPCPWCGNVIDTLCEQTIRPDDVVKCDHCDKPIEIKALADNGGVTIRRFNASK